MAQRFKLAHPPRNRLRGELPAIVEPALRDMPDFIGFAVDDVELVESDRDEPDYRFRDVAREAAMADERVHELVRDQQFAFIGVSRHDRRSPGVGDLVEADDEPVVLLVSDVEPGDRHYGTRRIFVGFGPPEDDGLAAYLDGEDTQGQDVVLWYSGHLQHHAHDGGDDWHGIGRNLAPFADWAS